MKIKAVFFDAGGTLFTPYPSVGEIYARAAAQHGFTCDPRVLESRFVELWAKRGGLSSLGGETSEAKERAWWHGLVKDIFEPYGFIPTYEEMFDGLHKSFTEKEQWQIYPETVETLQRLRAAKMALGIISNWDLRLKIVVRNLRLDHHFDFILGSSEVGATKPAEKIFQCALKLARVKPEEAVHVGDTYHEDYLGAERVGIKAFHLDRSGSGSHAPDDTSVNCLREFCELLGIPGNSKLVREMGQRVVGKPHPG